MAKATKVLVPPIIQPYKVVLELDEREAADLKDLLYQHGYSRNGNTTSALYSALWQAMNGSTK